MSDAAVVAQQGVAGGEPIEGRGEGMPEHSVGGAVLEHDDDDVCERWRKTPRDLRRLGACRTDHGHAGDDGEEGGSAEQHAATWCPWHQAAAPRTVTSGYARSAASESWVSLRRRNRSPATAAMTATATTVKATPAWRPLSVDPK